MTTAAATYAEYYGGVFPVESKVLDGEVYGPEGDDLLGNYVEVIASDVRDQVAFGPNASIDGTVVLPAANLVIDGEGYGAAGTEFTGTFAGLTALQIREALFHVDDVANRLRVSAVGAVELDSASLIRFVTEDTGETAAVDGSVAKLSQGGTGVTVLPAVGISADRSPGVTLHAFVGETITQSITLYETDGTTPIVLTGKTLTIVFETRQGVDVATISNSNITVSGTSDNVVTFAYPSAATSAQRVLKFALRDAAAPKTVYLQGLLNVTRAPSVDPAP
jgi:hypothetical protein